MADGIHVFNLPEDTTEQELKVYFSNPGNGGGHVQKILYPLPYNSAIVVFENPNTTHTIMEGCHVFREKKLSVYPLPKQVFGRTKVELEQNCSKFLKRNDHLVDELQYFGELKVEFLSNKKIFVLQGNWYMLEWALQYLNNALNTSGLESSEQEQDKEQARVDQWQGYEESSKAYDNVEPNKPEIKKPNVPLVRNPQMKTDQKQQIYTRTGRKIPVVTAIERAIMRGATSAYTREFATKYSDNSTGRYERETRDGAQAGSYVFEKTLTDSDNSEERYGALYRTRGHSATPLAPLSVFLSQDTENKPRPTRMTPERTRGIDVAQTDFGQAPLMCEFAMPNNLKVTVVMDDITKQSTDGIINPTSPDLSSAFGASRAILQACGYEMQKELLQYLITNGSLGLAQVFHTSAGGRLNKSVTHVLHTASPHWREDDSEAATHYLVCTYINCLVYADSDLWLQSIATPVISSGAFGFPLDVCIQAFYDAVLLFATNSTAQLHLRDINLVCFDQDTTAATIMILQSLSDCDTKQAIQAAADRYQTRYLTSNFAAENFNIDSSLSQANREKSTERLQPAKPRKNKNARMKKVEQPGDIETCMVKQEEASGLAGVVKLPDTVRVPKTLENACDNQAEKKTETRRKEDEYYIDSYEDKQKSSRTQVVKEQVIHANEAPQSINSLKNRDESSGDNIDDEDTDSVNVEIVSEDQDFTGEDFFVTDTNTSGMANFEREISEINDVDKLEEPESDVNIGEFQERKYEAENFEDEKIHKELYEDEYVEEIVDDRDVENMARSVAKTLRVASYDDCEELEIEPSSVIEEGFQISAINKQFNNEELSYATEGTDGEINRVREEEW